MKRRMPAVCLAFSGGLDTTYCALLLREEGYRVHAVTVDTGGFSPREKRTIAARAKAAGVERHVFVDGRAEVFERYALPLIFGNVLRGGVYPLSVAAERAVQVAAAARHARRIGARAIAHGSTAAGNDQFRFDAGLRVLAPGIEVRAPVRDSGISREEETAYCDARGVRIPAKTTRYSINEGLWGTTIGGGETHDPWELPPETLYPGNTLAKAPRKPRLAVVGFRKGRPVSLDGRRLDGIELVERLNALGRRYAAGRAVHLGDTILGAKGRIVFEAPAALALIAAHAELEKLVMTKEQRQLKALVAETYGRLLHEGLAFEPAALRRRRLPARHAGARDGGGEAPLLAGPVRGRRRAQPALSPSRFPRALRGIQRIPLAAGGEGSRQDPRAAGPALEAGRRAGKEESR